MHGLYWRWNFYSASHIGLQLANLIVYERIIAEKKIEPTIKNACNKIAIMRSYKYKWGRGYDVFKFLVSSTINDGKNCAFIAE